MKSKDIHIYRGSRTALWFEEDGDYSGYNARFVIKTSYNISEEPLVDVSETIVITYDETLQKSKFKVVIEAAHTDFLTNRSMVYDIEITNKLDHDDIETKFRGGVILVFDVGTKFDGYPLPNLTTSFLQLDASEFPVGTTILVGNDENGNKIGEAVTPTELKALMGIE